MNEKNGSKCPEDDNGEVESVSRSVKSRLLHAVRDALDHSAAAKSVRGKIRLQVLFSIPRQARELYPYAHFDAQDASKTARSHSVEAYVEHVFMTASYANDDDVEEEREEKEKGQMNKMEGKPKAKLMYALECFLYTLPRHRSAVLYVSKLDSSGWGPRLPAKHLQPFLPFQKDEASSSAAAPLHASTSITRVITEAFIRHFASLEHWNGQDERLPKVDHLSLHILARAQGAYLFPSSNENTTKHVLSDGQLIKWWRSVVTSVVGLAKNNQLDVRPFYIIPGYDRLESHILLPLPSADSDWIYGHPYSLKGAGLPDGSSLPPLPLSGPTFGKDGEMRLASTPSIMPSSLNAQHIATLLPHFPDDPKSRFIVELANDAHEITSISHNSIPPNKRRGIGTSAPIPTTVEYDNVRQTRSSTPGGRRSATPSTPPPPPSSAMTKAGRRTGSRSGTSSPSPVKLTTTQRQGMRERSALDRVHADEFWARMAFRQECCSGNAVGVFVALFTRQILTKDELNLSKTNINSGLNGNSGSGRSMAGQPLALPHQILQDIIFKRLMIDDCDWSKGELSIDLTRNWEHAIGQALQRKGNLKFALSEELAERDLNGDPRLVGKEIVWTEITLHGPTKGEIAEAEKRWKETVGDEAAKVEQEAISDPRRVAIAMQNVNVLPIKRKKKVV